jgi:hypothetical protein
LIERRQLTYGHHRRPPIFGSGGGSRDLRLTWRNHMSDRKNDERRTAAQRGEAPSLTPDEARDEEMDDEKAAKALSKIEELRRKLEPRG